MDKLASIIARVLLSRRTFIVFAIVLITYSVIGMLLLYTRGDTDYWEHLASIYSLAVNPVNPTNPYFLSDAPTHLFTPYHLFWGVVARLLSVHPFWLLPVIAGINMLLFVASLYTFSRRMLGDEKYAVFLILTLFFFWIDPWAWSGFYNFGLLPLTATYPYWFALSVALFVIAWYGEARRPLIQILHNLAACCVFLIHPLTGSFLILSLVVKAMTMTAIPTIKRLELSILPVLFTIAGAFLWPYFPVVRTVLQSNTFEEIGFAGNWRYFYEKAGLRILPALLGAPFVIYTLVRKQFSYLSVGLGVTVAIYFLNYAVFHDSTLARYVIFIAFFCHVGIVQTLKHVEQHPVHKYVVGGYLAILLLVLFPQLISSARYIGAFRDVLFGSPIGTHSDITTVRQYLPLNQYIGSSDVVMAPMETSWNLPGIVGCKVVGIINSNPFLSDFTQRQEATEVFFTDKSTAATRLDILAQYSVRYVLIPKAYEAVIGNFTTYLKPVYNSSEYTLYATR